MSGEPEVLRIERVVYGGYGLARLSRDAAASAALVPFTLPGELVRVQPAARAAEFELLNVLESSPARIQPGCPHFGVCGGCHLQMGSYAEQLRIKREVLLESLVRAGLRDVPEPRMHSADAWGYRNRIRLHVTSAGEVLRLGYRRRSSHELLPINTCPIAAPLLWRAAEAMLALAGQDEDMRIWLSAASEVELFCNDDETRVQVAFLATRRVAALRKGSFEQALATLAAALPELTGAGAVLVQPRSGRILSRLAEWGNEGLNYRVSAEAADERFWIALGSFFQVNRFLLPRLVDLVCAGRSGALAWDLFAGVGLFARALTRSFARVVAVEANPEAAAELKRSLARIGTTQSGAYEGVQTTAADFLRAGIVQRERPDMIVLDPPRAGAGSEVCSLLTGLAPREIVYVSCDPVTLARDLANLQAGGYHIHTLHLLDLFPQTFHQEAVVILRPGS